MIWKIPLATARMRAPLWRRVAVWTRYGAAEAGRWLMAVPREVGRWRDRDVAIGIGLGVFVVIGYLMTSGAYYVPAPRPPPPSVCAAGASLQWDGSAWQCQPPP